MERDTERTWSVVTGRDELVDRVRRLLASHATVREVKMFGGLSFMVDEKMVVCARGEGDLLVRVDPDRADELLTVDGARTSEMGAGRPMSANWITVTADALATDTGLGFWVGEALQYNAATPPRGSRSRDRD